MQADSPRTINYNLKTALLDFQKLKQQNSLPSKMQIKLQYLENKILNRTLIIEEYKQLPQYQLQSLQQCDKSSQISLFVSIVKCLSGRQTIVYFNNTKAYIKKQQSFSIWTKCYISCDSTFLYVKKKAQKKTNYYQFKIPLLKISKKYLEYKNKMCFGLMYQNKKYMLGFQQQTACQRIFKTLRQLVKQNHPQRQQKQSQKGTKSQQHFYQQKQKSQKFQSVVNQNVGSNQQFTKLSFHSCIGPKSLPNQPQPKSPSQHSSQSRSILQFEQDQTPQQQINISQLKQSQIYQAIKQQVKKQNVSSDDNYKLIKNFQLGRLLVYNGKLDQQLKQSKIKTSIILSLKQTTVDYPWLLEQYLLMKSWNLQIQQSKIIHKISSNSYKMYLSFKKYSLLSLNRWTIAIVTGISVDKKVYLLIRSCDQLTQEQMILGNYMSTVKIKKFEQTVQICKRNQKDDKILLTIVTTANFGGYCSKSDNFNMNLQVLSNMHNFYNFLLTQAISKDYQDNRIPLFEFKQQISQQQNTIKSQSKISQYSISRSELSNISASKRKQSYTSSEVSAEQVDNVFEEVQKQITFDKKKKSMINEQNIAQNKISSKQVEEALFKQFIKEFQTFQITQRGTQKLVELIKQKVQQKYYLKHRFIQLHQYNPLALKYNDEPAFDNWLLQKGKWRISNMELIFTNQQILAQQKNVIKLILKQLSSNVMSGKNIMNMSLPVQIFQNKSFLEKLGEVYGLFPYYFNLAAKQKNIVRQITYVTQAIAFATTICPNIQKPFNPILGETYQCIVGGVSLCFEQVSHHPPISSFYIKTDQYQSYGAHNPHVQMGLNTAVAKNINPVFVHFFETNTRYIGYGQDFEIGGLIFGSRTYKNNGKVNVFEQKNQILCQLSYGKSKKHIYQSSKKLKTGQIIGGVYRVSNSFTKRFHHLQWKHFDGIKYDQKIQELAKITGNWMGDFYVDNVKMRSMYDTPPNKPVKQIYVLPSDCSFRLDVFYKKMGDSKKSQQWKQVMQNLQRKDKKLRQQNSKQHPKHH